MNIIMDTKKTLQFLLFIQVFVAQAFGGLIVRFNSEHLVLIVISQRLLFLIKKNPFTFIFLI